MSQGAIEERDVITDLGTMTYGVRVVCGVAVGEGHVNMLLM